MGLLDSFLQGASNSAASTVSAPIDGLAWLLRKAGLPIPSNPVGGSDWLAQQGLTREPENRNMGLLGEAIGGVAPMVAAAKAPQIAKGLLQMEANAMAPRTLNPQTGAIVWHGSPHKFDKFDASKIGTGEGAQAYGHGIYTSENPNVAGEYAKNIMGPTATPENIALKVINATGDESVAVQRLKQIYPKMTNAEIQSSIGTAKLHQGNLYKVDLPDEHIAKMLDWDKPLSQQHPDVQAGIKELGDLVGQPDWHHAIKTDDKGSWFHRLLEDINKNSPRGVASDTAKDLQSVGIPGIRYLDGGSRGTGAGTSNFVIFPGNEGLLSILERNGQALR